MLLAADTHFSEAVPAFRYDGAGPLPACFRGGVLLLGSFDGFHPGHRMVLERGRAVARRAGVPLAVLQLDPHPRALFQGASRFRLVTGAARGLLLGQCGFDFVYAPRFDPQYAAMPARDFARRVLAGALGVRAVIVGADFRFGRGREGDVALLGALGRLHGFEVHAIGDVCREGRRISSSAIRQAILEGDLTKASRLLGRPWMTGISRGPSGWRFDPEQVLPPEGEWPVETCDAGGAVLTRTTLGLTAHGGLRLLAPSGCRIIRWGAPAAALPRAQPCAPQTSGHQA